MERIVATDPLPTASLLHRRLYAGDLLEFHGFVAFESLIQATRALLEDFFHPHAPEEIHRHLNPDRLAERIGQARRAYQTPEFVRRWHEFFGALGMGTKSHGADRLILRFQPPDRSTTGTSWSLNTARTPPHRDTWGTGLYAQINWWAPVYTLDLHRTFELYPQLWSVPVPNTSSAFDLDAAIERRKAGVPLKPADLLPTPIEWPDAVDSALPALLPPGSVLAFSAQHLHAARANLTDRTRISIDTRTLCIDDMQQGIGAPNVDGRHRRLGLSMFRRLSDGKPLSEVLTERGDLLDHRA